MSEAVLPLEDAPQAEEEPGKPYFLDVAAGDTDIAWRKRVAAVVWGMALIGLVGHVAERNRPLLHVDAATVPTLPIQRLENLTPDVLDAQALALEAARRLFRLHPATVAEDQAWAFNHSVGKLSDEKKTKAREIIDGTRKKKGEVKVAVKSVTPVKGDQPPFLVEVVLLQEFLGEYRAPGLGRPVPDNPRAEEYRWQFRLVQAPKTTDNPYALLVKDVGLVSIKS